MPQTFQCGLLADHIMTRLLPKLVLRSLAGAFAAIGAQCL